MGNVAQVAAADLQARDVAVKITLKIVEKEPHMNNKLIISSAIAGLVAFGTASGSALAQDKKAEKEKCYGVAKKSAND
ncbi:MAG: hypothetical protein ABI707_12865, partial [Ferruginibacter sp.]